MRWEQGKTCLLNDLSAPQLSGAQKIFNNVLIKAAGVTKINPKWKKR